MSAKAYKRLSGARRGFIRRNSSWAADDHLLLISGTRFQERYQRVFYRDVLGIVVERTRRFSAPWYWFAFPIWLLISVAVVAASYRTVTAADPAATRALGEAGFVLFVIMAFLLLVQVLLIFFGSCRVWIVTDVGNMEAPAVMRRWQAERFVAELRSRILAVQPSPAVPIVEAAEPEVTEPEVTEP